MAKPIGMAAVRAAREVAMPDGGLPQDLGRLFGDGGAGRYLDMDLPPGRVVEGAYWLSDGPAGPDLWARLRRAHPQSGLWPVIASTLDGEPERPWEEGEVSPQPAAGIDGLDADTVLAGYWRAWAEDGDQQHDFRELQPFGRDWPGLAPPGDGEEDPDAFAEEVVLVVDDGTSRMLLIPATCSADVVTAAGWEGPLNYTEDMAPLSAVLRSWETRFGARLIELGYATLVLAVAAPPVTAKHARRVAAEHFAFCPDNVVQGPGTITAYAEGIEGKHLWSFWWD